MKLPRNLLAFAILVLVPFAQPHVASAQPTGCPPGLAKKTPPCVPPGQAKKSVSPNEWTNKLQTGKIVKSDEAIFLENYSQYNLPRLPYSQRYAVVDDRIVVIDRNSYEVLQLIRAFTALAN